ncbi:MAG: hypothetical protein DRN15_02860 [Thermoprotei archaeon]|nr:MAG: hypothetical protein DRM97_05165 [Thermoprotei archaeon]RLF24344.1 MAG: hypothetical protein DRN15_02860 [Thermoprotei archaeon]
MQLYTLVFNIVLALSFLLNPMSFSPNISHLRIEDGAGDVKSYTLYYLIGVYANVSHVDESLDFIIPPNITGHLLNQTSSILMMEGDFILVHSDGIHAVLPLNLSRGAFGVFLVKVNLSVIKFIPKVKGYKVYLDSIPEDIIKDYVHEPDPIVFAFREELAEYLINYSVRRDEVVQMAYYLATYIMHTFIYVPGTLPRSIEEVVKSRMGDCDDLSTLFMELMWSYRIPCQLEYVGIFLKGSSKDLHIGKMNFHFTNIGRHAYALVFIGMDWLPVDITYCEEDNVFYASRYIEKIIVFERSKLPVNRTEVEEFLDFARRNFVEVWEELYDDEEVAMRRAKELHERLRSLVEERVRDPILPKESKDEALEQYDISVIEDVLVKLTFIVIVILIIAILIFRKASTKEEI